MAYSVKFGESWRVIVDGQPGPEYGEIMKNGPTFVDDTVVESLAIKQQALLRVRHVPAPAGREPDLPQPRLQEPARR